MQIKGSEKKNPNHLVKEKSPYLLQHAYNPVNWYPWGEEAFTEAQKRNLPIFLSVGYSTCHWCHVMERESFEDEEVAELLNKHYIAVKVDREERPDVDHIYMTVCQSLTGAGGWPLTVIMTPDKKPFFAGTYFPKQSMMGRPGLMDVLYQINEVWEKDQERLTDIGNKVTEAIRPSFGAAPGGNLTEKTLHKAFRQLSQRFDTTYGGFGSAPKFPTPHNLSFLLRYWKQHKDDHALSMVEKTLDAMHRGGIYDHIGFGFSRYSVDRKWLVPHFEKMLYDNALLANAYLEAYQATGKEHYARVARQVFTYVLRDMTSPDGGFYSAEDADSEGEEGKFYVWQPEEVEAVLGPETGRLFCDFFDITDRGNFEGHSIPNRIISSREQVAAEHNLPQADLDSRLEQAREKLFLAREKRVHPYKDDKVLTAWNGLMIAALARGGRVLGEPRYTEAADRSVQFIWDKLLRRDGRLLARYRDGEAAHLAYLDDYAFLAWGLLELYQTTLEPGHLEKALSLTEKMIELFWDSAEGGFFFYGKDGEELLARPKEVYDGATPSGNSVAAANLLRLARLTGDTRLDEYSRRQLEAFSGYLEDQPQAHTHFLTALQFALYPGIEVVIAGDADHKETHDMLQTVQQKFSPNTILILRPDGESGREIASLIPFVKEHQSIDGKSTAYVCRNYACQSPTTGVDELTLAISD